MAGARRAADLRAGITDVDPARLHPERGDLRPQRGGFRQAFGYHGRHLAVAMQ
jgi:hypothetical protein